MKKMIVFAAVTAAMLTSCGKRQEYFSSQGHILRNIETPIIRENNSYVPKQESEETTETVTEPEIKSKMIDVPYQSQKGGYPTGCELVSTSMILDYYGMKLSAGEFISRGYLQTSGFYWKSGDGRRYGGDPQKVFIGTPTDENGFGCFSGAVKSALDMYLDGERYKTADLSGSNLDDICREYINNDIPVLVWASIEMKPTYKSTKNIWLIEDTGEWFGWTSNEHCLVLVGYDEDNYYFNDPLNGEKTAYRKILVRKRYESLGMQSLAVIPENNGE